VKFYWFLFFLLFLCNSIYPEGFIGVVGGRNTGEHVFETGNKYPNLSGIRGGSRITYDRNFHFGGLEGGWVKNRFAIEGKFSTTGWGVKTNNSRDEDFVMGATSIEKGTKLSLIPLFLNDTANTFSGTRNFADGNAKSNVIQHKFDISARYYLGEGQGSRWSQKDSFYLSTGLTHSYFKYQLYDVKQWIAYPLTYAPIGVGLSYTYTFLEVPVGLGYVFNRGKFRFDLSAHLLLTYSNFRDFHKQRALNFIGSSLGIGFLYKTQIGYKISDDGMIQFSLTGHRQFTEGTFFTKGGLGSEDILSNFLGNYKAYISTKEAFFELSYIHRLQTKEEKAESSPIKETQIEKEPANQ
jgi:hypothetical protein